MASLIYFGQQLCYKTLLVFFGSPEAYGKLPFRFLGKGYSFKLMKAEKSRQIGLNWPISLRKSICKASYMNVLGILNTLNTPRWGISDMLFFSHLFVRSTANQSFCIIMERVLLTTRWQKKSMTLIPQLGVI